MSDYQAGERRYSLLIGSLKAAAAIAFLSFAAVQWLSASLDRKELSRLAAQAAKGEPATTGSITAAAKGTRLDPCVVPKKP